MWPGLPSGRHASTIPFSDREVLYSRLAPPSRCFCTACDTIWSKVHPATIQRLSLTFRHRVGRVLSFFSSRRNWDSSNPSTASECVPPPPQFWVYVLCAFRYSPGAELRNYMYVALTVPLYNYEKGLLYNGEFCNICITKRCLHNSMIVTHNDIDLKLLYDKRWK
jgi:hypothetical protein